MSSDACILLGAQLRAARESRSETLRVVAASVQIDSASLSKIERGQRLPTEAQTARLAAYFGFEDTDLQACRAAEEFVGRYGTGQLARRTVTLVCKALASPVARAKRESKR